MDKVKNFCDHSMILWEMAANQKSKGTLWPTPASFRVKDLFWQQILWKIHKEFQFVCICSLLSFYLGNKMQFFSLIEQFDKITIGYFFDNFFYVVSCWNCCQGSSNKLVQQVELHPKSCPYQFFPRTKTF